MSKFLTLMFATVILSQSTFANMSSDMGLKGLRNVKPVMEGVLYRGGNSGGGKAPLKSEALMNLCEAGFSLAVYLYPDGFKPKTVHCTTKDGKANTLEYIQKGFRDSKSREIVMTEIYDIIMSQNKGPAYVHCWNGSHASGETAAIALMQFCGLSGEAAGKYWADNIHDKGNLSKYGSIYKKHIPSFKPFNSLTIPQDIRAQVCR